MDNKILSIEIGEARTKICVISYRKKHPKIYQTILLDTPPDSIVDGFIQDKYALAKAIQEKLQGKYSKVTNVVFTVSSTRIATHEALIPKVKKKDIKAYVNAGAADYFPINLSEYEISYMILERIQINQDKKYRLLIIAVSNYLLTMYFELAKLLKLNIISMDYLGNSILQMLERQINPKNVHMFIQMNEKSTLINIIDHGVLKLARTIGYGLEASIPSVITNVNRVLEYYSSKNPEHPIQMLYLNGTSSENLDLGELFSQEFGLQVKLIDEYFMNCIGASVAPLGIFPKQYLQKKELKSSFKELIEIGAFVLVASIALIITSIAKVSGAERERASLNQFISNQDQMEEIYTLNGELAQKLQQLTVIDEGYNCNTDNLGDLFDQIEKKLPKNTIIHALQINESEILMNVSIDSLDAAAMTFVQLETIQLLKDIKTERIAVATDEYGVSTVSYNITAQYTPSGEEE